MGFETLVVFAFLREPLLATPVRFPLQHPTILGFSKIMTVLRNVSVNKNLAKLS